MSKSERAKLNSLRIQLAAVLGKLRKVRVSARSMLRAYRHVETDHQAADRLVDALDRTEEALSARFKEATRRLKELRKPAKKAASKPALPRRSAPKVRATAAQEENVMNALAYVTTRTTGATVPRSLVRGSVSANRFIDDASFTAAVKQLERAGRLRRVGRDQLQLLDGKAQLNLTARDIVQKVERLALRSASELAFVPDVVRAVGNRRIAWEQLLAAAELGTLELRPEGGINRLSAAELADSLPGPHGTRLSWVRVT